MEREARALLTNAADPVVRRDRQDRRKSALNVRLMPKGRSNCVLHVRMPHCRNAPWNVGVRASWKDVRCVHDNDLSILAFVFALSRKEKGRKGIRCPI